MKVFYLLLISMLCFLGCKKEAKCPTCENGTCVDGVCQCPPHWTGKTCSEQVTPHGITISSVTISKIPATDPNGAGWDFTSGPDVYMVLKVNGTVWFNTRDNPISNGGVNSSWLTTNLVLEPTDKISIDFYDFDTPDADDYMGGIQGLIYSSTNGFPTSILLQCDNCNVWVTLNNVDYI